MTPSETQSFITTSIFLGLLSVALYFILFRPLLFPAQRRHPDHDSGLSSSSKPTTVASNAERVPSHVRTDTKVQEGGYNILTQEGLVAFRNTLASSVPVDDAMRQDRVALMVELTRDTQVKVAPPKGSTIVLGIPGADMRCPHLARAVIALGTFYNLIVITAVLSDSTSMSWNDNLWKKQLEGMRENGVSSSILPDHRILQSSTASGRVALSRQLQRVELVVDFDPVVQTQLSRFGYHVRILDARENESVDGVSALGALLLAAQ